MPADAAVRASDRGALLDVTVKPESQEPGFPAGYNEWRERVEARVAAPARDGAANGELVEAVAAFFDVDQALIVQGAGGRKKTLLLPGVGADRARSRLREGSP
jgi:uncharacterized protein (TIGR00251 family)